MTSITELAPLLDLAHITVLRGGRAILDDLSLTVGLDEHVAIVGPNGCGKSTLLKVITRELYPVYDDATRCHILGRDRWDIFQLRTFLGIVTNDLDRAFAVETTIEEAVLSGFFSSLYVTHFHDVRPQMRIDVAEALDQMEIAHLAQRPVSTVSSGEARRALIARALVHRPQALVFDEPATALDIAAQRNVRLAMRRLANSGTGIVLVTHQLEDIIPEIERIIFLRSGKVVADGPKDELLTDAGLSDLFAAEIRATRHHGWFQAESW